MTISSASASISVSSLGPLNITIDSPDFGVTRSGFDITCNVVGMASSIVLRRDGGVVMTGTGSSLTASTDRFADGDNLGPGSYTCEAVVNGQSGVAWRFVKMKCEQFKNIMSVQSIRYMLYRLLSVQKLIFVEEHSTYSKYTVRHRALIWCIMAYFHYGFILDLSHLVYP